jgi:hypothetical protein
MKTQLEFLKEAVVLAEQNPTLKIIIASSDEHCEDKAWTQHHITKVEKTDYFCCEEEIFLDVDDVIDHLESLGVEITEEQAQEKLEEVILIYTNA